MIIAPRIWGDRSVVLAGVYIEEFPVGVGRYLRGVLGARGGHDSWRKW